MKNKTYYDWLEVSPKASPEVIEKAYKALVLKYHPDLQKNNSTNSEDILQKINEAYEVLSNPDKRANYDATLVNQFIPKQDYEKLKQELNELKNEQVTYQSYAQQEYYNNQAQVDYEQEFQKQVETAREQAYRDAYVQDMQNRGYKFRHKRSFKDYLRIVITILVIMIMIWIVWQIPFVRNWINSVADSNFVIRIIVDIIRSIYEALFETLFRS